MTATTRHTAAELEEAVRNGDTSIGPDDIAAARARDDHEQLLVEAASREEVRKAEAERAEAIQKLRDDIATFSTDTDNLVGLATTATDALDELVTALQARNKNLTALAGRARTLGIPQMTGTNEVDDESGIGWRAHTADTPDLAVDGRVLHPRHALDLLTRIADDITRRHQLRERSWAASLAPTVREQIESMERTITPPTRVPVRLTRRWGRNKAGATVHTTRENARWLIEKHMAEPVAHDQAVTAA